MRCVLPLLAMFSTGCAFFANTKAAADLDNHFNVATERVALAEAAAQKVDDRVDEIEAVLRAQGLDRASGQQTVEQMGADVAAMRGSIEEVQFAVKGLRADFDAYQMDQERRLLHAEARLAQIEKLLGVTAPPPPRLDAGTTPADTTTTVPASDPVNGNSTTATPATLDERLDLAEQRMADGQQAAARAILESALATGADHPRASEAQYRIAETWFNESKYKDAARSFQAVLDRYPKSPWAPWSMLRIGECFDGMSRPKDAKPFYDGVVRNYPGTDAAKEAAAKLAAMPH